MQTVLYDGSWEGFLCAVFDVYYYKFTEVDICPQSLYNGNVFQKIHTATFINPHSQRLWKGLQKKLSAEAQQQLYYTFLSAQPAIENMLLLYIQYVFSTETSIEKDYSHPAVITVTQMAKKVWKEKHRMEAFVRFQQTKDQLYYAIIEPDFNVLPVIINHFKSRYADQRWMIYDGKRWYGIYYDLHEVTTVEMFFDMESNSGKDINNVYDEHESIYQQLWQQYFKSVNIASRKNMKLQIKQMPVRYWKYLPEKRVYMDK